MGFAAATEGEFSQMLDSLDAQGVLRVGCGSAPRRRRITLAVASDDVLLALKDVRVLRNLIDG